MIRGAAIAIAVVAALSSGCASAMFPPHHVFHADRVYIYGRFLMQSDDNLTAAFSIRCRDGRRYKIEFSKDDVVTVIQLTPGVCQLEDVVYRSQGARREMASLRLLGNEHLEPGGVYYVGDFTVTGTIVDRTIEPNLGGFTMKTLTAWGPFAARNNYATTTNELRRRFPSFALVATEDRIPRQ